MDDTVKSLVQYSTFLVLLESCWHIIKDDPGYWRIGGIIFGISYFLCLFTELLGLKDSLIVRTNLFKNILSLCHGLDGIAALLIGISLYYRLEWLLWIGSLIMTKFFLIHLLNRMILANKKADTYFEGMIQTTKSYLHHVSSFLFVQSPNEIILTAIWRTISMFGHSLLVLRGKINPLVLNKFSWFLSYLRNLFLIILLVLCFINQDIRTSFSRSAIGHIAYMAVRLGPVFKLGSMYLDSSEKEEWTNMTDKERFLALIQGRHKWLALEIFLLTIAILYFGLLRVILFIEEINSVSLLPQNDVDLEFFNHIKLRGYIPNVLI